MLNIRLVWNYKHIHINFLRAGDTWNEFVAHDAEFECDSAIRYLDRCYSRCSTAIRASFHSRNRPRIFTSLDSCNSPKFIQHFGFHASNVIPLPYGQSLVYSTEFLLNCFIYLVFLIQNCIKSYSNTCRIIFW